MPAISTTIIAMMSQRSVTAQAPRREPGATGVALPGPRGEVRAPGF
jgi:hypothetical protein